MPEKRMKYNREFREGAVRIVEETNKSIAQVARGLGVNEGTLGNWGEPCTTRPVYEASAFRAVETFMYNARSPSTPVVLNPLRR